jgi:hypothetical protein
MKRGYRVIKISPCPSFPKRGDFSSLGKREVRRDFFNEAYPLSVKGYVQKFI